MAFTPRSPEEIRQNLVAYLVSTGVLSSIDEGDVVGTIFGGFAEELAALENKLLDFINGHLLAASGDLLDDRIAQIPNVAPRRSEIRAAGGAVRLFKSDVDENVFLPPNAIQIVNPNYSDIVYTNKDAVTIPAGSAELSDVYFFCLVPGTRGNAPASSVTQVVSGTGLTACVNVEPFTGGLDRETDFAFAQRAMAMIMSLARSQASAIEALALNFTDTAGTGILHAKAYEYVDMRRGYTELVVSNGEGMPGSKRAAVASGGLLPELEAGVRHTFWFEYPAASFPKLTVEGYSWRAEDWWVPIEEKGIAWTQGALPTDSGTVIFEAGSSWAISDYQVYQGWIAEFQEVVNRTCAAAGTRVRVVAAEVQPVRIAANCIVRTGSRAGAVLATVQSMIIEFFNRLAPGEPAFIHKLHDWVAQVQGVGNIIFYDTAGGLQKDLYPGSPRRKLSTNATLITLR
jgi:hypothetical protein